jgi:hypothetical protein
MGSEDDTVIMPRGEGDEPQPDGSPPGDSGGPNEPAGMEKVWIIATVVVIFIIATAIVVIIRACGGDEPAPQVRTITETVTGTAEDPPPAETQADTTEDPPARGDIEAVNWKSEVGAQPMVREVEDVIYDDLDGDGYDDALVLVRHEGSGAYLDYYIYTFQGESLVLLFDKSGVEHGRVELGPIPRSFVETTAIYAPADPNCCPSELQHTTYTWSSSANGFVETSVEIVPNPVP